MDNKQIQRIQILEQDILVQIHQHLHQLLQYIIHMISFSNLCKEHQLPIRYICISEKCGCIAKRYCQKCSDHHQRNYYRKCVLESAICSTIKSCVTPYQKIKKDGEGIKSQCLNFITDKQKKGQQARNRITYEFEEYIRVINKKAEWLQDFLTAQKRRFNQIIMMLNMKYINSLRKHQLLVVKVNLSNTKGLKDLGDKIATCQRLCKGYDEFLQAVEKYGDSNEEVLRELGSKKNSFKDGIKAVLGQNTIITTLTNNQEECSVYKENKVDKQRKPNRPNIPKPNQTKILFETPTKKPKISNKQNDIY